MALNRIYRYLRILAENSFSTSKISLSARISRTTVLGGRNVIHANADVSGATLGFGTFIGVRSALPDAHVGKFCSVAHDVEVLPYLHPSSGFVSTHPCFYSLKMQAGFTYVQEQGFVEYAGAFGDDGRRCSVVIGSDVWIGARAILLGGVRVGHGAIIGAGAVVTKDVAPYSVVVGVPARHVRFRFEQSEIDFLLNDLRWWDKGDTWLRKNAGLFKDIHMLSSSYK